MFQFKYLSAAVQKNYLILFAYTLLAVIFTHPTLWRLTSIVFGADAQDALQYTWTLWWAKESMLTLQQLPSNLSVWGFPEGVNHPLLFVTPYLDFVALPITLSLGAIAAYNVQLLLSFILAGFTTYLLAYAVTHHRLAGFAAGVIFSFSAHRWGHAFAGHLPHVTIYAGPLFAWAMWRFVCNPDKKRGLWVGLTAGLTGLVHVMHAAYWLLPIAVVFLGWGWWNCAGLVPQWWRKLTANSLWALPPLLILVGPFYLTFFAGLVNQSTDNLEAAGVTGNALDLFAFFVPAPGNPVLDRLGLIPELSHQVLPRLDSLDEGVAYMGIVGFALSLFGLMKWWGPKTRLWLWLTLVSAILALGPFLRIGGDLVVYDTGRVSSYIVMPYALLSQLPLLSWGRTTARLVQTSMLAVSILSAYGVLALAYYLKNSVKLVTVIVGLFLIFFLLESLVIFPMPQASPSVSSFYQQAETQMPSGGVLDLPLESRRESNSAIFYQTYHGQPIVGGFIHRKFEHVKTSQRFANLLFTPPPETTALPAPDGATRLAALRTIDIKTVVLHKDLISKPIDQKQSDYAQLLLGEPFYEDDLVATYRIPPGDLLDNPLILPDPMGWYLLPNNAGAVPVAGASQFYVYSPTSVQLGLFAKMTSIQKAALLLIYKNDTLYQKFLVSDSQLVNLPSSELEAGFSRIDFTGENDCGGGELCVPIQFNNVIWQTIPAPDAPIATWHDGDIELVKIDAVVDPATNKWILHLYWRPVRSMPVEPTIFVQLFEGDGDNQVIQSDHRLLNGNYPPEHWIPNALIQDVVLLPPEIDLSDKANKLFIGLYDVHTGERFAIVNDSSGENAVILSTLDLTR